MLFDIIAKDSHGGYCSFSTASLISDAVSFFWAVGYSADLVDAKTGEVLMSRIGQVITYSIFTR